MVDGPVFEKAALDEGVARFHVLRSKLGGMLMLMKGRIVMARMMVIVTCRSAVVHLGRTMCGSIVLLAEHHGVSHRHPAGEMNDGNREAPDHGGDDEDAGEMICARASRHIDASNLVSRDRFHEALSGLSSFECSRYVGDYRRRKAHRTTVTRRVTLRPPASNRMKYTPGASSVRHRKVWLPAA